MLSSSKPSLRVICSCGVSSPRQLDCLKSLCSLERGCGDGDQLDRLQHRLLAFSWWGAILFALVVTEELRALGPNPRHLHHFCDSVISSVKKGWWLSPPHRVARGQKEPLQMKHSVQESGIGKSPVSLWEVMRRVCFLRGTSKPWMRPEQQYLVLES